MISFIAILTIIFVVTPILGLIIGKLEEKKENLRNERKKFLFNFSLPERNIFPEDVFNTLDTAGIEISFSKYTNNLD